MSPNDPQRAEIAEVGEEAMPLPVDVKVAYLGGTFLILLLAALYAVAEIVWPLVFAFILSLLLKPPMRLVARLRLPRVLCALLLVVAVLGLVAGLGTAISSPAARWAAKLPEGLPHLFQRLRFLEASFSTLQHFWQPIENFAGWAGKCKLIAGRHPSHKAVHWHSKFRQRLLRNASVSVFPPCRRGHFSPATGGNYAAL